MSNVEIYSRVAKAFTAIDIAQHVVYADADDTGFEVVDKISFGRRDVWLCLVRRGQNIIGYLAADDDINYDEVAGKQANPITPNQLVPASIPILDLIPLFEQYFFFFVLEKNQITHAVSFVDVDKLPVKLCLFSLFMELESEMLAIMNHYANYSTTPEALLNHLSAKRLEKAREVCKLKYGKEPTPELLLQCTTFIDEVKIFQSEVSLSKCLPFRSKNEGNRFFTTIEKMRNQIAHSDSILSVIDNPSELHAFTLDLQKLIKSLSVVETQDK